MGIFVREMSLEKTNYYSYNKIRTYAKLYVKYYNACGFDNETCKHYFLDCPLYNTECDILMTDIRNFNLTLRNLPYGDDNLSGEFNVFGIFGLAKHRFRIKVN